ncbi:MAG: hypothetical protein NVS1B9_05980 [Solirubrobacteraceae bacterium]
MNILRRLPTAKLIGSIAAIVVLAGSITAVAFGALAGSGPVPPAKSLPQAIHDALGGKRPQGVSAKISFTNSLVDASSVAGASALLKGATGRLWGSNDGRLRLELQSQRGDTQILVTPTRYFIYDASSKTAYEGTLPAKQADAKPEAARALPSVAKIQDELTRLMQRVGISSPVATNIGGAPAYSVRFSPKHSGGLLGSAQLAFDAVSGVPLRAAVYAQNSTAPVLELTATSVAFGPVDPSVFAIAPPADAKVVQVKQPAAAAAGKRRGHAKLSRVAVSTLPFKLSAPASLAGLPHTATKALAWNGKPAALVTYGRHLGAIVVIERQVDATSTAATAPKKRGEASLPTVSINGVSGTELATALGTLLQFDRAGISYTIAGSVPPAAAEAAARGL